MKSTTMMMVKVLIRVDEAENWSIEKSSAMLDSAHPWLMTRDDAEVRLRKAISALAAEQGLQPELSRKAIEHLATVGLEMPTVAAPYARVTLKGGRYKPYAHVYVRREF